MSTIATRNRGPDTRGRGFVDRLRRFGGLRRSDWIWGYIFISLNVIGFLIFSLGPILASLGLAFMDWPLLKPPRFVGLDNVAKLLQDAMFRTTMLNTAYFVAGFVPLVTILAFLLALLLNRPLRGISVMRAAYFMPSITLIVSVAMVWHWMLDPQAGVINWLLKAVGLPRPEWLADRHWAMPVIIMVAVWQDIGYYSVIYLAGLQTIPGSLYEAALMDGANAFQRTVYLTVPLMSPTTFFVITASLISGWQVFGLPYLMTGGGPADSTRTLLLYTYQQAFASYKMGYASLMAWILCLVIFAVTLFQWRFLRGGEYALAE